MRHLSEVVDFEALLARDEALGAREGGAALLVRDRALAAHLDDPRPRGRLRQWLELRRRAEPDLSGERAGSVVVIAGWVLGLVGVAAGVGTATALLAYDGRDPVNVLAWLLYVAALPFALAALLVLGLGLPERWAPKAGPAQALVAAVIEPLLRRLPGGAQWGRLVFHRGSRAGAALQRWLFVALTQIFTLGFIGAALATLLIKVTITDLTFGWSTTLDLADHQVTALVKTVAAPWQEIWPEAVPDAEAVGRSNYRRFVDRFRDTERREAVDVTLGATWWKWSAMAAVTYGVLPRLVLLLIALWRFRAALALWPDLDRPDVQALLARFEDAGGAFAPRRVQRRAAPEVEPRDARERPGPGEVELGETSEAQVAPRDARDQPAPRRGRREAQVAREVPDPSAAGTGGPRAPVEVGAHEGAALGPNGTPGGLAVAWGAAAGEPELAARVLDAPPDVVLGAGADLDLSAEREVLSAAAERGGPVTVLMPLSEPPIEDVLGFLRELRSIAPRVVLVPLTKEASGWRSTPADAVWRRALGQVDGVEAHEG